MNRIFIDLEMNSVSREYKEARICSRWEVIEFGAVCLNDENRETGRFHSYVRPEYNHRVTAYISELTGIKTSQVKNAESFKTVFENFTSWCGSNYRIYSWSDTDLLQLQKEMELKGIENSPETLYMFEHWEDLQKDFSNLLFLEKQTSLSMAVANAGVTFKGNAHNALTDALAAADIYREMSEGRNLKQINTMLTDAQRPIGSSLGDLLKDVILQPE